MVECLAELANALAEYPTKAVFDAVADGVVVLDEHQGILALNGAAEHLFGYRSAELVGRHIGVLVPGVAPERPAAGPVMARRRDGVRLSLKLRQGESELAGRRILVWGCQTTEGGGAAAGVGRPLTDFDILTGCLTRDAFLRQFTDFVDGRRGDRAGLMYVDLVGFKQVNDHYGHHAGDYVLAAFGRRLRALFPGEDAMVGRMGGDEFVVCLPGIETRDAIGHHAGALVRASESPLHYEEFQIVLDCNVGCALHPFDGDRAEVLLQHADLAMYHTKGSVAQRWAHYVPDLSHAAARRNAIMQRLRRVRPEADLGFVYQPTFDLLSRRPASLECLMRWNDPELGVVNPVEFMPIAESAGILRSWTRAVLAQACRDNQRLIDTGVVDVPVSVNVSMQQLYDDAFVEHVFDALTDSGMAGDRLEIEMTERALFDGGERARAVMAQLRPQGVRFSLDDFGSGSSSLGDLNRLDFDHFKIDHAFVAALGSGEREGGVVAMIVALARTMQVITVAEGIETAEQEEALRSLGCTRGQGFWLATPLPAATLALQGLEDAWGLWPGAPAQAGGLPCGKAR